MLLEILRKSQGSWGGGGGRVGVGVGGTKFFETPKCPRHSLL